MGLFDALSAQTPQGDQLRAGLLGMGAGLLQGSVGNYGQFAPALGAGFAGFGQGMQNAQAMQLRQQQAEQEKQMRDLRAMQIKREQAQQDQMNAFFAPQNGAQIYPVGDGQPGAADALQARIQQAMNSGNPMLMDWAVKQMTFANQAQQAAMRGNQLELDEWSAPIQTSRGFGQVNRRTGEFRPIMADGAPLMPTTIDPNAQGAVSYAKTAGSEAAKGEAERNNAQLERDRQDQQRMELFDVAESILPQASSGAMSNLWTAAQDAAGVSSDASKANAQLRVIAGQMLGMVPRFEGPQSDKDVQAYREMAGDLANPLIPVETRMATLKRMRQMILDRKGGGKQQQLDDILGF